MISLDQFKNVLSENPESGLQLLLPTGETIPSHFHITEVGYVTKDFIDCGGTRRTTSSCVLQSLIAHDIDHRLKADKLAGILQLSGKVVPDSSVPVEIEYDAGTVSTYAFGSVVPSRDGKVIVISLEAKHTACLAPDKCGLEELDEKAEQATAGVPAAAEPRTDPAASGC
jgi:hypothetical protein